MKMIRDCFEQEVGEVGSLEMVELRELQDMVDEGYPSDAQLERYEELARKFDPDRLNVRLEIPKDSPSPEEITRYEHSDRPSDDRLNGLEYDGAEDEKGYMNMGKAVSYATLNHRWIKSPSPFIKGDKEYNRKVYLYLSNKLEKKEWEKVSGVRKKTLVNYLQIWIPLPDWMKVRAPSLAAYLSVFVFGDIVTDYREAVIQKYPQLFKRDKGFKSENKPWVYPS